jgi:hypothetical protein
VGGLYGFKSVSRSYLTDILVISDLLIYLIEYYVLAAEMDSKEFKLIF